MGDSQSKEFGNQYLDKLSGQLDKNAPVFNQSLFAGAGDATKNAWGIGTQFGNTMVNQGGLTGPQRQAMDVYAGAIPDFGNTLNYTTPTLSGAIEGYKGIGANGGLNDTQTNALNRIGLLANNYGDMATAYDPNSAAYKTLRQNIADDTLSNIGSQFTSSGRFGGGSYLQGAGEGLGNALAGLDYTNMQNDINNRYRAMEGVQNVFGDVFNKSQQGTANLFGALAGQTGAANDIFNNHTAATNAKLGAANSLFNAGQTGIGNTQAAIDSLGQIGAARDANQQGKLLGEADLFDRTKNAELDRLLKIGAGFGDPVGAANQAPWWQQGLGALLGLGGSALSGGAFGG